METSIAIVGGGLSGLALARHLHDAGCDFQLFEARDRLGGRIKTHRHSGAGFDLGPSWFWPGQRRMEALVHDLGLQLFDQYAKGAVSFEDETGHVVRNSVHASMPGSLRLEGGMAKLVSALAAGLPTERLHTGCPVQSLSRDGTITTSDGRSCKADTIVVALPPRVAAGLVFEPELDHRQMRALQDIPTWMAGHAKFVAIYDRPFWRDAGLSGDAMSRHGPLAEIHDASSLATSGPAALFGFLGLPVSHRQDKDTAIIQASLAQLARIFGPEATAPVETVYLDWAFEARTASRLDHAPLSHHPAYGMPEVLRSLWDGKLHICSTEVAPEMGGYLEGALAIAETTAEVVMKGRV